MMLTLIIPWAAYWHYTVFFVVLLVSLFIILYSDYHKTLAPYFPKDLMFVFAFCIAVFFALEPVILYSDKWLYQFGFKHIADKHSNVKDWGFYWYNKLLHFFTKSSFVYFFITALVYCSGYIVFISRHIVSKYRFLMFLGAVSYLGFMSYGTNTIRAGIALSFFLILLSRRYFLNITSLFLAILIILLHKSFLLPVLVLVITLFYQRKDNFLSLWIICLIASAVSGNFFVGLFGEYFSFTDDRLVEYTDSKDVLYNTGFRIDFIFYSVIPILLGFLYKKKGFNETFYNQMLSLYIIVNAFWLLLIRMPYSDRFASLSWFLIPFVILYPLLWKRIFERQNVWIASVLFCNAFFTFALNILR